MSEKGSIIYCTRDGFRLDTESGSITPSLGNSESCWQISGNIGDGRIRRIEMNSGFNLWITDCFFRQGVTVMSDDSFPFLSLNFYLSSDAMGSSGMGNNSFRMKGGQMGMFYMPELGGSNSVMPNTSLRFVEIEMPIDRLSSYLDDDLDHLPRVLRRIIRGNYKNVFHNVATMSPAMEHTLHQIFECPFYGVSRRLFLESRTLELIAYMFHDISGLFGSETKHYIIHPTDRKNTETAKNRLIKELENPPSLIELARSVGMSHPKLNRCFRQMYGTTVFQYLRNERLKRAREMLSHGLNVTEAAYAVGYESVSHFSQAFKKQFNASPRSCMG